MKYFSYLATLLLFCGTSTFAAPNANTTNKVQVATVETDHGVFFGEPVRLALPVYLSNAVIQILTLHSHAKQQSLIDVSPIFLLSKVLPVYLSINLSNIPAFLLRNGPSISGTPQLAPNVLVAMGSALLVKGTVIRLMDATSVVTAARIRRGARIRPRSLASAIRIFGGPFGGFCVREKLGKMIEDGVVFTV